MRRLSSFCFQMKSRMQRPPEKELKLESVAADDPSLPRPRGRLPKSQKPSISELAHLRSTQLAGGLVPEIAGQQYWQCSHCGSIHQSRQAAKSCHEGASANRIQTCKDCGQRLINCVCKKRSPKT